MDEIGEMSMQEKYAPNSICFGCGPANKKGLKIKSYRNGEGLKMEFQTSEEHQAFPGIINGGIIGTLLDCHGNWVAAIALMDEEGLEMPPCTVTASYSIKLRRPTPANSKLSIKGKVLEIKGKMVNVELEMKAGEKICATGEGTFVAIEEGHLHIIDGINVTISVIQRYPLERPNESLIMQYPSTRLDELGLQEKIVSFLKSEWKIKELFPPQSEALPYSLKGENVMLTIPTASGKSLIAYLTIIHRLANDLGGKKAIYVVPLKALAKEKFRDLKEITTQTNLKVGLAIGDREGEISRIDNADIIVCTSEKLDSLIRTKSGFMDKIGILVVDEFHLINDFGRGPTLEIVLSRIRHKRQNVQIIALSATVGNSEKLSNWLNARLIKSNWRPVALEYGTLNGLEVTIHKIDSKKIEEHPKTRIIDGRETQRLSAILDDTVKSKGQLLIFVASRASAQKEARDLAKHVIKKSKMNSTIYSKKNINLWSELSNSLSNKQDLTALGNKLVLALKGGVGFHHAGPE